MANTDLKDRRRGERVTLWSPVELSAEDGSAPAALRNLSVAGLCCTTSRKFPELALVKIRLDLPGPDEATGRLQLELSGAVVRCIPLRHGTGKRRFEVALYFTELTPKARAQLASLVQARMP
jgi:hypothetical protein